MDTRPGGPVGRRAQGDVGGRPVTGGTVVLVLNERFQLPHYASTGQVSAFPIQTQPPPDVNTASQVDHRLVSIPWVVGAVALALALARAHPPVGPAGERATAAVTGSR
ncbi:hypothetical protein Misp04_10150 [Micromonospora sp. NBRC 101691]|nr:hypothetical protein Misp04_10150 [Micromonospora sp. NBRC 101691]